LCLHVIVVTMRKPIAPLKIWDGNSSVHRMNHQVQHGEFLELAAQIPGGCLTWNHLA